MKRSLIARVPDDLRPKWIWHDPGPRSSYPRMGPQDAKLIDLAWRLGVLKADAVTYDAPVGRIRVTWVHESDVERHLYEELLKPRADMVTLRTPTVSVRQSPIATYVGTKCRHTTGFEQASWLGQPSTSC